MTLPFLTAVAQPPGRHASISRSQPDNPPLPTASLRGRLRRGLAPALCLALAFVPQLAAADWFNEGKARVGVEYELEKGAGNAWQSRGITLITGLKLDNRWIHMVEVLAEGAHEHQAEEGRSNERKLGVRIRHDFPLSDDTRIVLRGLLGHARQGEESFLYYYVEPSFRWAFGDVEMMLGYRYVHGLNTGPEHDLHKFRLGPSIDLGEHSEIEFRWARSWNMHTGKHVSDAYIVEYTQRF